MLSPHKKKKIKWKVGDTCKLSFHVLEAGSDLSKGVHIITAVKDTTKDKGTTGQWVTTDRHPDWIDRYWVNKTKLTAKRK